MVFRHPESPQTEAIYRRLLDGDGIVLHLMTVLDPVGLVTFQGPQTRTPIRSQTTKTLVSPHCTTLWTTSDNGLKVWRLEMSTPPPWNPIRFANHETLVFFFVLMLHSASLFEANDALMGGSCTQSPDGSCRSRPTSSVASAEGRNPNPHHPGPPGTDGQVECVHSKVVLLLITFFLLLLPLIYSPPISSQCFSFLF